MNLLLDTCTFVWLIGGDEASVSPRAREAMATPTNGLFLSAISVAEIAIKHARGGLEILSDPSRLIPELRARHRIEPLPFDERAALTLAKLPRIHKDPFDRMLVSQAIAGGLTILTPDDAIRRYPVAIAW